MPIKGVKEHQLDNYYKEEQEEYNNYNKSNMTNRSNAYNDMD